MPYSIQIRRTFQAPREKVFASWTQKDVLEKWMCKDVPAHQTNFVELDVRTGGKYVMEIPLADGGKYIGHGVYREVKPPEKLVFTWAWDRIPPKAGDHLPTTESVVTVELFDRGAATEMLFTHELLETTSERDDTDKGWHGCFLVLDGSLATNALSV
jgi:uncharacterized protein YndB with AHSA1/START domain